MYAALSNNTKTCFLEAGNDRAGDITPRCVWLNAIESVRSTAMVAEAPNSLFGGAYKRFEILRQLFHFAIAKEAYCSVCSTR